MRDLLDQGERSFSFEFFPPRDEEGERQLWDALRTLEPYRPTFVSVTYGAGGSSRDTTVRVTGRIAQETSLLPMAHLTCVGHTRAELSAILDEYAAAGVHHVMALRGDPKACPRAEWTPTPDGLSYASELVEMAHARGEFRVAAEWYYRRFDDGVVRRVPTAEEVAGLEESLPGVKITIVPREGERLSRLQAQDSYSYELAKIVIGAEDETEMRAKYERCVEALKFEFEEVDGPSDKLTEH